jgi:hypothetical protein
MLQISNAMHFFFLKVNRFFIKLDVRFDLRVNRYLIRPIETKIKFER